MSREPHVFARHAHDETTRTQEFARVSRSGGELTGGESTGGGFDAVLMDPAELDLDPAQLDLDPVDLRDDPFADDLSEQLVARAPRRYASRATAVLAGVLLMVGGFVAGAQVQRHWGGSASPAATPGGGTRGGGGAGPAAGPAAGGAGAPGGTGRQAGNTITGTVQLVDGTTVYIKTADGQVVTVQTSATTAVQVAGSIKDLPAGATVSITGQTGTDGSVAATTITKAK